MNALSISESVSSASSRNATITSHPAETQRRDSGERGDQSAESATVLIEPEKRTKTARIYLAGPGVFAKNARALADEQIAECKKRDFIGLHPLDAEFKLYGEELPREIAARISGADIAMLKKSDAVAADLSPFRSASADAGTIFEVGYAIALGKPVVAYANDRRSYIDKVAEHLPLSKSGDEMRDPQGDLVENFTMPDNLMIACNVLPNSADDKIYHPDLATALATLRIHLATKRATSVTRGAAETWAP